MFTSSGSFSFVSSLGLPLPGFIAVIVAVMEVVGGLLLIVGLGTRWVSLWYVFEMIEIPNMGFIAPQGKPGVGAELDLLLLFSALVLLAHGSGRLSIEHDLLKREL